MGGRIAMLGVPPKPAPVDWTKIVFKLLTIKGIYGREMFETWHKMIAMLQSGLDVRKVVTHRLPAADFRRRLRGHALRPRRQGRARLDRRRGGGVTGGDRARRRPARARARAQTRPGAPARFAERMRRRRRR